MRVIRLVCVLILFLLVGGQMLLPAPTYATCCRNGCYPGFCTCPGVGNCPYARPPVSDLDTVQASAPTRDGTLDIRDARSLDATERVAHLMKVGDCARRSFAMTILGDAGKALEVESFNLDQKVTHDGTLLFQVAGNMER